MKLDYVILNNNNIYYECLTVILYQYCYKKQKPDFIITLSTKTYLKFCCSF